jgi:hypothetical protein
MFLYEISTCMQVLYNTKWPGIITLLLVIGTPPLHADSVRLQAWHQFGSCDALLLLLLQLLLLLVVARQCCLLTGW